MSETTIKQWGNSAAVIIPAEEMKARNLKVGDDIILTVAKKADLRKVFGSLKHILKDTAQEMKDETRASDA